MNSTDERVFVYLALLLLSALVGAGIGLMAGLWSFLQIVAVVELTYWLGLPGSRSRLAIKG